MWVHCFIDGGKSVASLETAIVCPLLDVSCCLGV